MAKDWKGKVCIISVVGTRNIKRRDGPILWSFPNKRNPTPPIKQTMAINKRKVAKLNGIPLDAIELATEENLNILGGMAIANVVDKQSLPRKSIDWLLDGKFIRE